MRTAFVRSIAVAVVLGCLLGIAGRAWAGEPPAEPMMKIESGMHSAPIVRIGTDSGRLLATGSDDGTVRVWDLADGRQLQVLRPPLGESASGNIRGVAMSPDGKSIACSTVITEEGSRSIYLFARADGTLRRRLTGLPKAALDLTWSPDGRFLAAVLGAGGLRVFRVQDGTVAFQDDDYAEGSYGADFDRTGRLVTTCLDGLVRLYDAQFHLVAKQRVTGGNHPGRVRFAPDGSQVAVGFLDAPRVALGRVDIHGLASLSKRRPRRGAGP